MTLPVFDPLVKKIVYHNHKTLLVDTAANILASSPSQATVYLGSDTGKLYFWDGSSWHVSELKLNEYTAPDMGYPSPNPPQGYGEDFITDKTLHNVVLQGSIRADNGSIRIDVSNDPDTFEIFLRSEWQTIIYDLTTAEGDFRHTPLSEPIYVWRGDSVALSLSGRPVIQEYEVSMGAYSPARVLYGGTF